MYHYDSIENDLVKAWQLLHELSEYNAHNQKLAANLHSVANSLKVCYEVSFMYGTTTKRETSE